MGFLARSVLALGVVAVACGDGGSTPPDAAIPDAMVDATVYDAGPLDPSDCPTSYGPSTVYTYLAMVEDETKGFDLDGDQTIDNILSPAWSLVNDDFTDSIADGSFRLMAEMRGLASVEAGGSFSIAVFGGVDSDEPANLEDDFDGNEDYYFAHDWVDPADCTPLALGTGNIASGKLTGSFDKMQLYVESLGGFLQIRKAKLEAQVVVHGKGLRTVEGMRGVFGGVIDQCSLVKGQAILGQNAQHAITQFLQIQPDIDMDGDGLETVQSDSAGILSCTDGDGTVVPGEMCGCDPRMADGYSVAFVFDTVGAAILGPAPEAQ